MRGLGLSETHEPSELTHTPACVRHMVPAIAKLSVHFPKGFGLTASEQELLLTQCNCLKVISVWQILAL